MREILQKDVFCFLKALSANSIDLVISSPRPVTQIDPYLGMADIHRLTTARRPRVTRTA